MFGHTIAQNKVPGGFCIILDQDARGSMEAWEAVVLRRLVDHIKAHKAVRTVRARVKIEG